MFNGKIPALFMQVSRVDQIILIYDLFYFFLTPANTLALCTQVT